jgi:basic amino acid/polyamine antiporter, APA family
VCQPVDQLISEGAADNEMKRSLGMWDLTAVGIGGIIGTGK